eukprot:2398056-Rhodomonas_salina.1
MSPIRCHATTSNTRSAFRVQSHRPTIILLRICRWIAICHAMSGTQKGCASQVGAVQAARERSQASRKRSRALGRDASLWRCAFCDAVSIAGIFRQFVVFDRASEWLHTFSVCVVEETPTPRQEKVSEAARARARLPPFTMQSMHEQ